MEQANLINVLGGPAAVARMCKVKPPSVLEWRKRGIPAERCPVIERAVGARITCEELRPDIRWYRVPDPEWPHPAGRPCIDVAAPGAQVAPVGPAQVAGAVAEEVRDAA